MNINILFALLCLKCFQEIIAIEDCDKVENKKTLCLLDPNYDIGLPDNVNNKPLKLFNSITLLSVGEFDAELHTISLIFLLTVKWNDTRLTLNHANASL